MLGLGPGSTRNPSFPEVTLSGSLAAICYGALSSSSSAQVYETVGRAFCSS